jgi:hypothetical protein
MDSTRATLEDLFAQEKFETEEGVWVPITLHGKPLGEIKVVNTSLSDEYGKFLRALIKKYRAKRNLKPGKELPDDDFIEIGRECLLKKGILDFRGFMRADGTELPTRDEFNNLHQDNLRSLVNSPSVLGQLRKALEDQDTFNKERLEEIEKN